jgi:hypothetical protein
MARLAASLCWADKQFEIFADENEQESEISVHFCDTGRRFCPVNFFCWAAACFIFVHVD